VGGPVAAAGMLEEYVFEESQGVVRCRGVIANSSSLRSSFVSAASTASISAYVLRRPLPVHVKITVSPTNLTSSSLNSTAELRPVDNKRLPRQHHLARPRPVRLRVRPGRDDRLRECRGERDAAAAQRRDGRERQGSRWRGVEQAVVRGDSGAAGRAELCGSE
jgi:hypothetical protein